MLTTRYHQVCAHLGEYITVHLQKHGLTYYGNVKDQYQSFIYTHIDFLTYKVQSKQDTETAKHNTHK